MPEPMPNNSPVPAKPEPEPEIFVMPRGAPPPKITRKPIKIGRTKILIIGGVLFVAVLGGIGWWMVRSAKPKVETPVVVETPAPPTTPPEAPVVPPETSSTGTPEVTPEAIPPRSGVDADSDGLTDAEEDLYKSNVFNPDTDGDLYLDGNEVFHLYSPVGQTPTTLLDSGLVKIYQNQTFGFILWYPASWEAKEKGEGSREIDFIAPSGESITVSASDNLENKTLEEWYLANTPGAKPEDLKPLATKGGKTGLQSEDRFTAYFAKDGKILTVKYNLENRSTIEFRTTFGMMIRSLVY